MSGHQSKPDFEGACTSTGKYLTGFQRKLLQKSLRADLPQHYRQRIEIMLLADDGNSQIEICQTLGCCPATARHWILMARTGMAHNWQNNPIGRPKAVNQEHLERLKELVSQSPKEFGYPFRRWTANWLSKHLAQEFGIEVSDRHISRLLKQMGLSTKGKPRNPESNTTENDTPSKDKASNTSSDRVAARTEHPVAARTEHPVAWPTANRIIICDLQSASSADSRELLSTTLSRSDLDIHGSKCIYSVDFP
ncbi:helix-turn-helix domain-containing protein [Moorena sp. SIO4G3]|uniref:helix-turn-helix domain-containing protein n=1 Tax=Moorena sp. SIO4G3 TaxID=2607821 RepID=UPI00142C76FB|nr:helix-turn-helix domain-containing protein [Moorena sp. SIO4G3]